MRKKVSVGVTFGLVFLAAVVAALATMLVFQQKTNAMLGGLSEKQSRYEVLDDLDSIIAAHYYGNNDSRGLRHAIANGYVSGLGDDFSRLMTAEEYAKYQAVREGRMQGVGLTYKKTDSGTLRVDAVAEDSPAAQAGMKKGDVIVAVDAIPLDSSNSDEIAEKLENANVVSLNVTYSRKKQEKTVTLEKGYEASSVTAKTYQNLGYLKISEFYASTAAQVQSAVDTFLASGVQALIIDVRGNTGTSVENAIATLDVFVPLNQDNPAASLLNKAGETVTTYSTAAGEVNLPMAVLISSETRGAGELFACNLRDFGKAQLVGTRTRGNALVGETFRLTNGDTLLLSVGVMLPYKSESFHETGVAPDVQATLEEETKQLSKDSQFLAAAALFTE